MNTKMIILVAALVYAPVLRAQDAALVEVLAPVLQSEDQRVLNVGALTTALEYPSPFVRRMAVRAVGRIGKRDGLLLLETRLFDNDPAVVAETMFSIGLIGHSDGVALIIDRLRASDSLSVTAVHESAIALSRIGSEAASAELRDVIRGVGNIPPRRRRMMLSEAVLEAWRLKSAAPVEELRRLTRDTSATIRWRAVFSLGRLGSPEALDELLIAARDRTPLVREYAVKALRKSLADSAGTGHSAILRELSRALVDEARGVRINATVSAGTFADTSIADELRIVLKDRDRLVRVSAAAALGELVGEETGSWLAEVINNRDADWSLRKTALVSLAKVDPAKFASLSKPWLESRDRFDRLAALEGLRSIENADPTIFRDATRSSDPVTRAAAIGSWAESDPGSADMMAAAGAAFHDPDIDVRSAALMALSDTASDEVLDRISDAWRSNDRELRQTAVLALAKVAGRDRRLLARLSTTKRRGMLNRPSDHDLRALAVRRVPLLGARWGGVGTVETGKVLQDYRELASHMLLAGTNPRVVIDVENRGKVEIKLLPREAPLTVANFLLLLDRGWFNGIRFHRVVPNFVVQGGDPTGGGNGGPDWSIRDEINRLRYDQPMLGMALSGPDTGGSQWFINLSPQPHLNGGYTIFGEVVGSYGPLNRIQQGDLIRTIQRLGPS